MEFSTEHVLPAHWLERYLTPRWRRRQRRVRPLTDLNLVHAIGDSERESELRRGEVLADAGTSAQPA